MNDRKLTTANGRPVADNQNTQTVGPRGQVLLQDPWLIEKLAHFDREVIPERRMLKVQVPMVLLPLQMTSQNTQKPRYSAK